MTKKQLIGASLRASTIQTPIIPYIAQLIKDNQDTISFGQGIVDYPPPDEVQNSVNLFFSDRENHRYKPVEGLPRLKQGIFEKLEKENNINIQQPWGLFVTAGSNMAFLQAILAITDPGDEVIILSPYYFNHEMAIRLANATPVTVNTDASYQPKLEKITRAITKKTRAIVTISPNNPTGAVYPKETLIAINELCAKHSLYHINDEAYEYFVYDAAQHYSPAAHDNANQHTISLFSFSKTYAMASWRIGYMLVPSHLVDAIKKIQDTNLICAPAICQFAAHTALKKGRTFFQAPINKIAKKREIITNILSKHADTISYTLPYGAFYFFININHHDNAMNIAKYLIEEHKVAVIPGETFGASDKPYFRIGYGAVNKPEIERGLSRLIRGINEIK